MQHARMKKTDASLKGGQLASKVNWNMCPIRISEWYQIKETVSSTF